MNEVASVNSDTLTQEICTLGIDLGGSAIKYGLATKNGELLFSQIKNSHGLISKANTLSSIYSCVEESLEYAKQNNLIVKGVGFGSPGLVNCSNGVIEGLADNLAGWNGFNLGSELASTIKLPVFIDNDANLSALGEVAFGDAKSKKNVIVITIGTGIGGAILLDGKIFRGVSYAAGEFGNVQFLTQGVNGNTSFPSWESIASTSAMVSKFSKQLHAKCTRFPKEINGKFLFDEYKSGNPIAKEIIDENLGWMSLGISNLIHIFDPELIVIGGGISDGGSFYIDEIRSRLIKLLAHRDENNINVVAASLGNKAGILGASHYAFCQLDSNY
ncbi:ROK family protein [Thalassotalea sp. SU-HH00458]|uniref:ROK family protein n=1 Tax=Thalassotalea sp. SU-HH00458 TaxID=3127657 RepID=UPI003109D5E1